MIDLTSKDLDFYTNAALQLAKEGASALTKYWGKVRHIQNKDIAGDLVTEADKESERLIIEKLKQLCPSHAILAEESGKHESKGSEFLWVVDPLDGTTNFAHHYPVFAVSVALVYQGKPIIGVVFNPVQNELFQATLGRGSFLNGMPLHVSKISILSESLLASGFPYDRRQNPDNNYAEFCHLTHLTQGVRRGGAAALDLAYVSAGRLEGYWEREIKAWDVAAGIVLVQEAGGLVSGYDGLPVDMYSGRIVATNGLVHQELLREIVAAKKASPR